MMATASKPASSPICVKAGFSFARSAIVVPGRRYSSFASATSPIASLTGKIDLSKKPDCCACAARRWLSTA